MNTRDKLAAAIDADPEFLNDLRQTIEAARWLQPMARAACKSGNCAPEVAEWLHQLEERLQNALDLVN